MSKKPTDQDIDSLFEGIDAPSKDQSSAAINAPPPSTAQAPDDLFDDLIPRRSEHASRPHTPRVQSNAATPALKGSPIKRPGTATPPSSEGTGNRSSEEKGQQSRKSGESTRSFHKSFTPGSTEDSQSSSDERVAKDKEAAAAAAQQNAEIQAQSSGGGWWGGLFATASAAVKQAEALAKEVQKSEEAQRWAEQVKGNVGALRGLGGQISSRALPTFSNILQTLAPPISSHERLQIHITHDLTNYPSLEPLTHSVFSRVMAQVEGGELLVLQRGRESTQKSTEEASSSANNSRSGWSDGPWWRSGSESRSLGSVGGLVEGTKLARASAEGYANDYYAARGGLEEAAKAATQDLSESNSVRYSDIFLALQAVQHKSDNALFDHGKATASASEPQTAEDSPEETEELISFAIYLHDPIHGITFSTITQSVPSQWTSWLSSSDNASSSSLPADIATIIHTGGVDPREWVAEWLEETLTLGVGVVAQRYVARRMGVGVKGQPGEAALEGGKRYGVEDAGGGEGARVL